MSNILTRCWLHAFHQFVYVKKGRAILHIYLLKSYRQRQYLVFLMGQQPDRWQGFQRHGPGPVIHGAAAADKLEQRTLLGHASMGHSPLQGNPQLLVEDARTH